MAYRCKKIKTLKTIPNWLIDMSLKFFYRYLNIVLYIIEDEFSYKIVVRLKIHFFLNNFFK